MSRGGSNAPASSRRPPPAWRPRDGSVSRPTPGPPLHSFPCMESSRSMQLHEDPEPRGKRPTLRARRARVMQSRRRILRAVVALMLWPWCSKADEATRPVDGDTAGQDRSTAETPEPSTAQQPAALADALRVRRQLLQRELGNRGFTVVEHSPFLVVGDEPPERVRQRAAGTVRWALRHLNRDYFRAAPERPVELWVLRDEASYQRMARGRLGIRPSTPFGFYSPTQAAIMVNGATGAGTLVHEMVHALLAVDFPDSPAWFNEGFASLFEQCEERQGTIWGLPNWRLRGLQRALERRELPRLEQLCGLDTAAFYGAGDSLHYAQARYLCLYLQDRGVLRGYYARFRESQADDPTGYATLRSVLGGIQPVELERDWAAYVAKLTPPEENNGPPAAPAIPGNRTPTPEEAGP